MMCFLQKHLFKTCPAVEKTTVIIWETIARTSLCDFKGIVPNRESVLFHSFSESLQGGYGN
jgi:hypothetical protein